LSFHLATAAGQSSVVTFSGNLRRTNKRTFFLRNAGKKIKRCATTRATCIVGRQHTGREWEGGQDPSASLRIIIHVRVTFDLLSPTGIARRRADRTHRPPGRKSRGTHHDFAGTFEHSRCTYYVDRAVNLQPNSWFFFSPRYAFPSLFERARAFAI